MQTSPGCRSVRRVPGDQFAAEGLLAGCDIWHSTIGGVLPAAALRLARAGLAGDAAWARVQPAPLEPLGALFAEHGCARVVAAVAWELGLADSDFPLHPLRPLDAAARGRVREVLDAAGADSAG